MSKITSPTLILLATAVVGVSAGATSPVSATWDEPAVQSQPKRIRKTPNIDPRIGPLKPAQSTEQQGDPQSVQAIASNKRVKTIAAFYLCDVELQRLSLATGKTVQALQFTISSREDGSFVYGGKDPLDTWSSYNLVDNGEWRMLERAGTIEGEEMEAMNAQISGAVLAARINRQTGEFSAENNSGAGANAVKRTYTGFCTGGV